MLFHRPLPSQNLIENDGAECCGADSSHREVAELERQVAGTGRKRCTDGDQIPLVGEIDFVLNPDPAGHGGDQPKQHDRQAADDRGRDRQDERAKFWREAEQDGDDGGNGKQKRRIYLRCRHHTDILGVSRDTGASAEAGHNRCQTVSQKGATQEAVEASACHRTDGFDVTEVLGDENDRHGCDQEHRIGMEARSGKLGQAYPWRGSQLRKVDGLPQSEPICEQKIQQVSANGSEDDRQSAPNSPRRDRNQPEIRTVSSPTVVSNWLPFTDLTATGARLRPITATTAPVTTGGIKCSIQPTPDLITIRAMTPYSTPAAMMPPSATSRFGFGPCPE